MKKKSLLWMSMFLLMLAGLSGCSADDDFNCVQDFSDNTNKENFIGTWHLIRYYNGWGTNEEYDSGEITVTFTKNGEMEVVNKRKDQRPIPTGTFSYSFVNIERSIYSGESATYISFGPIYYYTYIFDKGYLHLSAEAFDGPGFTLQKLNQ